MPHDDVTGDLFFGRAELDRAAVDRVVAGALAGGDDGELFLEYRQTETIDLDDGQIKSATFDTKQGFGLRAVSGEAVGYAHAGSLAQDALERAAATVRAVRAGHGGTMAEPPAGTNRALYTDTNPLALMPFAAKVALLGEIDAYVRAKEPRARQAMASLLGSWQAVRIVRADGLHTSDVRPLVRLSISVVLGDGGRLESGSYHCGGRATYDRFLDPASWRLAADEAIRQASANLEAVAAPAGDTVVVLGPGRPGVLFHEAVGHGLESDFIRKGTSAFCGRMGERVAAPGVTVVDDGTIPDRRGSITIDDEGTPSGRTVLIEDGILTGYLFDRQNARLMNAASTGSGRRDSYAYHPMPRMTNTFMLGGGHDPDEIVRSVKRGLYAVNFGGGQVDTTSGKFVFSATEAYLIEDGKVTAPVKGATLIGNGPDALKRVTMIGNDMRLDPGTGTCGKEVQWVPTGVGQPTIRIDGLTVGGTAM